MGGFVGSPVSGFKYTLAGQLPIAHGKDPTFNFLSSVVGGGPRGRRLAASTFTITQSDRFQEL